MDAEAELLVMVGLLREWRYANAEGFRGALRPPLLALGETGSRLGTWARLGRTITLSRRFVAEAPWVAVTEVLRHEMAHQYADEVLKATDETAHGPAFRQGCARLGIDPTASGALGGSPESGQSKVLDRVRKLLALAGSANEHEAEAAMNAAQRLMLEHNLDAGAVNGGRPYETRQVGPVKGRRQAWERVLGGMMGRFFFVEAVTVPAIDAKRGVDGTVLQLVGTRENLDYAAWAYDYLVVTGERLWRTHKRAHQLRSDADRAQFLAGVMSGVSRKLADGERAAAETGLVWVGDPGLDVHFDARFPRVRTGRAITVRAGTAWEHGKAAGAEVELHRPLTHDVTSRGRQLGGPTGGR